VNEHDRVRLLFGPYQAPAVRRGDRATCLVRGRDVVITSWTDAPIPWPRCRPADLAAGRGVGLLIDGELARAIRREAAQAVSHWWGVALSTVWTWRKALGVGATTEGTSRLRREYAREPAVRRGLERAWARASDPARRAKIAAARRGKRRADGGPGSGGNP
jgi:hypothetical protein